VRITSRERGRTLVLAMDTYTIMPSPRKQAFYQFTLGTLLNPVLEKRVEADQGKGERPRC
jgi:hypothetical protein